MQLRAYGYDDLSSRAPVSRPNGVSSSYTHEDTDTLGHAIGGGAAVNYAFDYNRALQITSRSTDNDGYAWNNDSSGTRSYAANGLDQYDRIVGDAPLWDGRGNLLFYRNTSYGYDGENRLAAVNRPGGMVAMGYDPAGRLWQTSAGAATQFLYDGDQLIAEYNAGSGALTHRYVPGGGADETALAYDGSGTRSWYHEDAQGSVVAASDASGNASVINQYGPYGEPGVVSPGRNQGRVRYTGQTILSEVGTTSGDQPLYDYRARIYAPRLGRFLQTDPIGTADDLNLYTYVGNDPVNLTDPSGLLADSPRTRQVASTVADFIPVISDLKGFYEAYRDPTLLNIAAAGVGLFPLGGDLAAKGLKALPAGAARSLTDQAADLVKLNNGRNRVTLRSPSVRIDVDLAGRSHGTVPTPHTKISERNYRAPQQPAYNTNNAAVNPDTQQQIRMVRNYLNSIKKE